MRECTGEGSEGPDDFHNFLCDIFYSDNGFFSLNEKRELDYAPKGVLTAYIFSYKIRKKENLEIQTIFYEVKCVPFLFQPLKHKSCD